MPTESQSNFNGNESREGPPEDIEARAILVESRLGRIISSKEVQGGTVALVRTLINAGISLADLFPGVGEIASWSADALKSHTVKKLFKWLGLPDFDLTPSVSRAVAWGTECMEAVTFGAMPSHSIEAILQFKREDLERLKKAFLVIREILKDEKELKVAKAEEVDAAISKFK